MMAVSEALNSSPFLTPFATYNRAWFHFHFAMLRKANPVNLRLDMRIVLVLGCLLAIDACQSNPIAAPPPVSTTPTQTPVSMNLVGRPIRAADRGEVYRLMEDGTLRHIMDL